MKTLEEFVYRLQNDSEFEQKAQAFEDSEEFMNFITDEGYEFTLDQLLDMFKDEGATKLPVKPSPEPAHTVEDFIQRLEKDPEFERQAQAFDNDEAFMNFVKEAGYNFKLDELTAGFKRNKKSMDFGDQALLTGVPVLAPSPLRSPGSESSKQTEASLPGDQSQSTTTRLIPRFEGGSGGRRRGMKWGIVDS